MEKQVNEKRVIRLDKEEIDKVKDFRNKYAELTDLLGQMEINLAILKQDYENIEKQKTKTKSDYLQLRNDEMKFAKELKAKYGEGQIDIEDGTFLPKS